VTRTPAEVARVADALTDAGNRIQQQEFVGDDDRNLASSLILAAEYLRRFGRKLLAALADAPAQPQNCTEAVTAERKRIREQLLKVVTDHVAEGSDVVYDWLLVAIRELAATPGDTP
jgi:hypothetical protein